MKSLYALCAAVLISSPALAEDEIFSTQPENETYQITIEQNEFDDSFIKVVGTMGSGFDNALYEFMVANPEISFIELKSNGGILGEISKSGQYIHKNEIPIVIASGERCISSCAFLALFSPDITINGLLALHLPFNSTYGRTQTLYDISQSNVEITVFMARDLFRNGWSLLLYYIIAVGTDIDTYLVFDETDELNKFRISDAANYVDTVSDVEYHIITYDEMLSMSAIQ